MPIGFLGAEASERFVEQQQTRPGGECQPDLQPTLLAVRERPGAGVDAIGKIDFRRERPCLVEE